MSQRDEMTLHLFEERARLAESIKKWNANAITGILDAISPSLKNMYKQGFNQGRFVFKEPLSDKDIESIVESLPGGALGYTKTWGWLDLARAIEKAHGIE